MTVPEPLVLRYPLDASLQDAMDLAIGRFVRTLTSVESDIRHSILVRIGQLLGVSVTGQLALHGIIYQERFSVFLERSLAAYAELYPASAYLAEQTALRKRLEGIFELRNLMCHNPVVYTPFAPEPFAITKQMGTAMVSKMAYFDVTPTLVDSARSDLTLAARRLLATLWDQPTPPPVHEWQYKPASRNARNPYRSK